MKAKEDGSNGKELTWVFLAMEYTIISPLSLAAAKYLSSEEKERLRMAPRVLKEWYAFTYSFPVS